MNLSSATLNQTKKKKKLTSHDNFIEALKGIGSNIKQTVTRDLILGADQTAEKQTPNPEIQVEQQTALMEHRRLHNLKTKEEIVYSARVEKTENEIKQIQKELKGLAQQLGDTAKEIQVAAIQQPISPGEYHLSFFAHLKKIISNLRKKLSDSSTWLQTSNNRASRRQGYWGQVKKQGTNFMLSHERKMATQSG